MKFYFSGSNLYNCFWPRTSVQQWISCIDFFPPIFTLNISLLGPTFSVFSLEIPSIVSSRPNPASESFGPLIQWVNTPATQQRDYSLGFHQYHQPLASKPSPDTKPLLITPHADTTGSTYTEGHLDIPPRRVISRNLVNTAGRWECELG